jgi:hypothetical protein
MKHPGVSHDKRRRSENSSRRLLREPTMSKGQEDDKRDILDAGTRNLPVAAAPEPSTDDESSVQIFKTKCRNYVIYYVTRTGHDRSGDFVSSLFLRPLSSHGIIFTSTLSAVIFTNHKLPRCALSKETADNDIY